MTPETKGRVGWTPPYPAPEGYEWREQSGHHYLAHERAEIDERAEIGEWARIGKRARIGGWARIGEWAKIGEGASIGEGAEIGERAEIDEWAKIGEGANISERAWIGERARIGEWASGLVTGMTLGYRWTAYRDAGGTGHLSYGCELLTWDEWREQLRTFCERHGRSRADQYERAIGALLDALPALIDATMPEDL